MTLLSPLHTHNLLKDAHGGFHILHILHHHTSLAVLLAEVAITGVRTHISDNLAEGGTLIVRTIGIAYKEQRHSSGFQEDFLSSQALGEATERHDAEQLLTFVRYLAEAVFQP